MHACRLADEDSLALCSPITFEGHGQEVAQPWTPHCKMHPYILHTNGRGCQTQHSHTEPGPVHLLGSAAATVTATHAHLHQDDCPSAGGGGGHEYVTFRMIITGVPVPSHAGSAEVGAGGWGAHARMLLV